MKRIIFCGSRDWTDRKMIKDVLYALREVEGTFYVVHGAARGADTIVNLVAHGMGLPREAFPADWKNLPRWEAGPKRNQQMLDSGADMVVAFKDGFNHKLDKGGTEDMVRRAVLADVPTVLYTHDHATPRSFAAHADEAKATAAGVQRRDEGGGPPTLWEHMRDPDVREIRDALPPPEAATPR